MSIFILHGKKIILIILFLVASWVLWVQNKNHISHFYNLKTTITDIPKVSTTSNLEAIVEPMSTPSLYIAQTVRDTSVFAGEPHTEKLATLPEGQMVEVLRQTEDWLSVRLYNSETTGYMRPGDVIKCPNDEMDGFTLPKNSYSVIDPETDAVEPLFVSEKGPPVNQLPKIDDINLPKAAQRFGVKGDVAPDVSRHSGVFLPNGIYATIEGDDGDGSVFFIDTKAKSLVGIIHPMLQNGDITLCGNKLYVATGELWETKSGTLNVIDYKAMRIVSTIKLGGAAASLLCWKDVKLYATSIPKSAVEIIDIKTDSVIKSLRVGPDPWKLWKCRENKICVKNYGDVHFEVW